MGACATGSRKAREGARRRGAPAMKVIREPFLKVREPGRRRANIIRTMNMALTIARARDAGILRL